MPHPLEDVAHVLDHGAVVDPHALEPANAARPSASEDARSAVRAPRAAGFTDLPGGAAEAAVATAAGASAAEDSGADVQTLGELLQQARESRGLSVEETSARTRISLKMLGHLENDRFGEFAADAYVKGFLRNYGNFLGLDVDMLVRRYETLAGHVAVAPVEVWDEVIETRTGRRRWRPTRRTLTTIAVVVVVATLTWVFWSRGAAKLGLRPTPGLQQIENELRAVPEHTPRLEAGIDAGAPSERAPESSEAIPEAPTADAPRPAQTSPTKTGAAASTPTPKAVTPPPPAQPRPSPPRTQAPTRVQPQPEEPKPTQPEARQPTTPAPRPTPPPRDASPPRERRPPPPPEPADPPR